jgi:RNA polymerase sigma factor (sigma-70 family)
MLTDHVLAQPTANETPLRIALRLERNATPADRNQAAAKLQPHLFAVALGVASRFRNIDAYDCALDAVQVWWCFAAAFAFAKYDPKRPLWPYACQSLRYITSRQAKKRRRCSCGTAEVPDDAGTDTDPYDAAERSEFSTAAGSAIKRLPPHMQAAMQMRFHQEMLLREIAVLLGVPTVKVHRWIEEALATLHDDLAAFHP